MFDIIFNYGVLGFLGVMIKNDKLCVVLMFVGGILKYIYDNLYLIY